MPLMDAPGKARGGAFTDMTARIVSETQLALSESRYRSLVHATSSIVWVTDSKGLPLDDLSSWRAFTGQTPEEVAGREMWKALHPEDLARAVKAMEEAIASGKTYEIEYRLRRHDGAYRNMLAREVPVRDRSGNIVEWVGMLTDITNQKLAEKGRELSESRFRKLFESDLMGIAIPDRFGGFREANDELLRIIGYTREDLKAGLVRWDTMTPPEYRELDAAHIAEAARRGSCTPYEKEYLRRDGTRVPILCGYALLEGSQDEYIGFVQDLTVQKLAEAKLREREQRFSVLADSLPQLIWIADADGHNTFCNRRCLEYHGVALEDATGAFWRTMVHPDDLSATVNSWDHSMQTGEPYKCEFRLRRHDGVYRYFLASGIPVRDNAGKIERWVGISTDIHDQKILEEGLRRSEKLSAASRLAASIAHEIYNPLASVTNALFLALQDKNLSAVTRKYLTLADQELARVAHVTTQSLRFHKQSSAPTMVDISDAMNLSFALFAPRFEAAEISVVRDYRTQQKVYCYGDEMRQVFAHLLSNSLDATSRGGQVRIRIRQSQSWDDQGTRGIKVIVADTGSGVPLGVRNQAFEAFVSTKNPTGAGLGLWVTEGIIRKHNGTIRLRSRTDSLHHGTVLSIFIPFIGVTE